MSICLSNLKSKKKIIHFNQDYFKIVNEVILNPDSIQFSQ